MSPGLGQAGQEGKGAEPQLSGAIFTTTEDGTRVDANLYAEKCDVYLNGGPEHEGAAGLPEGDYYFQVTEPAAGEPAATLLSTDTISQRQVHVDSTGRITGVSGAGDHQTSANEVDGGATVQLCPFLDTTNPGCEYKVWLTPVADYDEFRTWMRIKNYRESREIIDKEVPQAAMILRTEGANAIVDGLSPADPNPHLRHAFYSQRRVAAIGGMIEKSKAFAYHSDYTTLPYTPTELRKLTKMGVQQGIIPAWLPQFDNMRDIAVNGKYGTDYQMNYNVDKPVKGAMMHVLTPVYTWFKAVIEEGGIPGILWEDLQCDGFTTETQQREMLFFKEKMKQYLASPEGKKAATQNVAKPDRSWMKKTQPKQSYIID
jgi:hypothetical protein